MTRVKIYISILFIALTTACDTAHKTQIDTKSTTSQTANLAEVTMSNPFPDNSWWKPGLGLTWQWQIGSALDFELQVDVWDIDLGVHKSVVDKLHSLDSKVICYISVGSHENWRTDADLFPNEVLGKKYEGWSGERWLDIRRIDLLAPIMLARLDDCAAKGFDGVEPDNMEIYTNDTGFPLTYDDQLQYALWLAEEAHKRGLAIGQKNAPDQTKDLVQVFDFAITEDAFYYGWAEEMLPYIQAGKPVFAAEYTDMPGNFFDFCQKSNELGFSTILKHRDLDGWLQTCQQ
jgi:hypothetical protein